MFGVKLGLEHWREIEKDLERISGGEPLEIVANLTLVATDAEHIEEDHEHHHEHVEENDFTKSVAGLIEYIAHKYNAHVHPHVHSTHGTITFAVKGQPKELIKVLKDVVEYVKTNCENYVLHTLDGEFHLGDDLSAIYFGDSYKITVILPHVDGRRLKVIEAHY